MTNANEHENAGCVSLRLTWLSSALNDSVACAAADEPSRSASTSSIRKLGIDGP